MNIEESRIVAHVCGDGWLTTYIEKHALHVVHGKRYYQRRIKYEIGYCNNAKELLKEFEEDMFTQFNIKPRRIRTELRFRSKRVFQRILELGGGKSRTWFISKEILNSNNKIKKEWVRAFFDDECTFDPISGRIRVKSMNLEGLKQIKKILLDLNLISNITGPNIDESFYITIKKRDILKLFNIFKFKHELKRSKLESYLKEQKLI